MPTNRDIDQIDTKLRDVEKRLDNARGASSTLETQVGRVIDQLIIKGNGLEATLKSVNSSLLSTVNRMGIINPILNQIFGTQKSTINDGLLGAFGSSITDLFGGVFGGSTTATRAPTQTLTNSATTTQSLMSQGQISASIADAVRRGSRLR